LKNYIDSLVKYYSNPVKLENAVDLIFNTIERNKNIWLIGNGGSASTAEHFEIDLMYIKTKMNLGLIKSTALTTNSSVITAIANDLGFRYIFSAQLERKAAEGDLCIMISASGNSENLIEAIKVCRLKQVKTLALLGFNGGELLTLVDLFLHVKTEIGAYGVVEDIHLSICHQISVLLLEKLKSIP
jgi:D-sedoheptulose 7-phosphate isomerase